MSLPAFVRISAGISRLLQADAGFVDASLEVTHVYDTAGILGPDAAAGAGNGRIVSGFVRATKRQ